MENESIQWTAELKQILDESKGCDERVRKISIDLITMYNSISHLRSKLTILEEENPNELVYILDNVRQLTPSNINDFSSEGYGPYGALVLMDALCEENSDIAKELNKESVDISEKLPNGLNLKNCNLPSGKSFLVYIMECCNNGNKNNNFINSLIINKKVDINAVGCDGSCALTKTLAIWLPPREYAFKRILLILDNPELNESSIRKALAMARHCVANDDTVCISAGYNVGACYVPIVKLFESKLHSLK